MYRFEIFGGNHFEARRIHVEQTFFTIDSFDAFGFGFENCAQSGFGQSNINLTALCSLAFSGV